MLRPGSPPGAHFVLCAKRQKGRLERTAKPRAHGSMPAAAAGRLESDDDAQSRTHWSKTIPCAYMESFSIFKSILLDFRVVQRRQKQSPEAEIRDPGSHTGRLEDHKASGP